MVFGGTLHWFPTGGMVSPDSPGGLGGVLDVISHMVLPVITTAVAGGIAIPFIGVPAGALAGLLAGGAMNALIIGFSASAAVDWLLTRTDEAFSRESFEFELRSAVKQAADSFEARVVSTMAQYVEREYRQLAVAAFGHKP